MNNVLAVLHDKDLEPNAILLFKDLDPLVDPVQTVSLISWPVVRADDAVNIVIPFPDNFDFTVGVRVIGIGPHEDVKIAVVEGTDGIM
jgi:hypothetical protein